MRLIYALTILLLFFFCSLKAQNENLVINSRKFSSLSFVYGWHKNPKNGKWTTKKSEIKEIDKFDSYTIFTLTFEGQDYVCVMKLTAKSSLYVYDLYFVDYEDYKNKIARWEKNTTIRFPIIKHVNMEEKKKLNSFSLDGFDLTGLKKQADSTARSFVFQYKFDYDNTVKFLFYIEECFSSRCQFSGLNGKNAPSYTPLLDTDELFDNFFYKTMYENFINFIDTPFK